MTKTECYQSQVARFDGGIRINGADYVAVDTVDGYFTVRDVPIFSEIAKGTHGAPYDVTKQVLERFLSSMQSRYSKKRAGALSIGHNDDFGLTHPAFAGFFLPTRVAQYEFPEKGKRWTLFADLKIPADKFDLFKSGKLPYHSPEIYPASWSAYKIDIVSFLDTKPPYFDWATNTVKQIVRDPAAHFDAVYVHGRMFTAEDLLDGDLGKLLDAETRKAVASRFASMNVVEEKTERKIERREDGKSPKEDSKKGDEKPDAKRDEDTFEADYPMAHRMMKSAYATISKLAEKLGLANEDPLEKKADHKPVEPGEDPKAGGGAKMAMDPETAAKFAAQENELAAIKKKLLDKEREDRVAAYVARAHKTLEKKVLSSPEIIAKFAADAAAMEPAAGDKWFGETVDKLAPMLRDKPPSSVSEFMADSLPSVDPQNPVLSKFAAKGEDMSLVAKFAAQHAKIKGLLGDKFTCTVESYIENELAQAKSSVAGAERR